MATFRRFEDILAWQRARELVRAIYLSSSNGNFSRDFELRNQVCRSSVSIMANIAEGQGRRTEPGLHEFP
jgi:four helix bundle protein